MKMWMSGLVAAVAMVSSIQDSFAFGSHKSSDPGTPAIIDFRVGDATVGGTACPADNTRITQERNGNDLTIHIHSAQFLAQLDPSENGRTIDRKGCAVALPIAQLAEGAQLKIAQVSLKGSYDVRASVDARATIEGFLSGSQGPQSNIALTSGDDSAGDLKVIVADSVHTCKSSEILRLNTALNLRSPDGSAAGSRKSSVVVDELTLVIRAEPCQE